MTWIVSNIALAALLALAALFAQRRLKRPGLAHLLWVLVMVKLLTPPLIRFPAEEPACNTCPSTKPAEAEWWLYILPVWGVGAVITMALARHRWRRLKRLITLAGPAPEKWRQLADECAAEMGVSAPELLAAPGRLPPMVIPGRPRPILLLPAAILEVLNDDQRTALVLHELEHLRRRDHWVRTLELAVRVVYWWLPFTGWLGRQLRDCEEACCDAAVVARRPDARREYARLLLDVIDFSCSVPSRAMAMTAAQGLELRLKSILQNPPKPRSRFSGAAMIVLAVGMLPLGWQTTASAQSTVMLAPEPETVSEPAEESRRGKVDSCCCPPPRPTHWTANID